jgi:hypothetical protein
MTMKVKKKEKGINKRNKGKPKRRMEEKETE